MKAWIIWDMLPPIAATRRISTQRPDLVRKLGGFGIAAIIYVGRNGEKLIKITGYPGIRRILNGTRYKLNNVQVVRVGLGTKGINNGIMAGIRWNVYASLAFHSVELIFRDGNDTAKFLGDVTADMAKTIVIAAGTRAAASLILSAAAVSIGGTFIIVAIVLFGTAVALNVIDKEFGMSELIIEKIRDLDRAAPNTSDVLGMHSQLLFKKI